MNFARMNQSEAGRQVDASLKGATRGTARSLAAILLTPAARGDQSASHARRSSQLQRKVGVGGGIFLLKKHPLLLYRYRHHHRMERARAKPRWQREKKKGRKKKREEKKKEKQERRNLAAPIKIPIRFRRRRRRRRPWLYRL